ncbi:MAG: hypothetical protein H0W10_05840, partial [Chloroflexi bacterium]|nr:hypothetical protein [Chloroflexota bacterium]
DRDTTRIVRSWLEEGVTALPDRVLDAVLDQLPTTPQRRITWWPARRFQNMNTSVKLGLAAAAVVVAALLGYNYLVAPNVGGPGLDEPTTSATPSAATRQMPTAGDLDAGTYRVSNWDTPRSLTVTVPAGWNTGDGFIGKGDVFVGTWIITHVFEDACHRPESDADALVELVEARTPAAITEALAAQGGHETVGPSAQTLGGYPAQLLEFRVPADFDIATCGGIIRLWPGAGPDLSSGQLAFVGQRMDVYVVDLDGEAVVVIAAHPDDALVADIAEMESILESIDFAEPAP